MTLLETGKRLTVLQKQMFRIRLLENRLQKLCDAGLGADLHFSKGQEAICVGVCAALRDTDYVATHHRSIAHASAKGVPLEELLQEVLYGKAGEMHMGFPSERFMFCWQLVGTCVPVAAGLAWAVKHHLKTDDIVVVFHGDAASANGQWHEGMNLAAVQKVPLLVVCENNHLAGNVRAEHYQPVRRVRCVLDRASAYGIPGKVVNGNDVEGVLQAAKYGADYVRFHGEPYFLECNTTRLGRHKQGQGDLRTREEMEQLAELDPLRGLEAPPSLAAEIEAVIQRVQAGDN